MTFLIYNYVMIACIYYIWEMSCRINVLNLQPMYLYLTKINPPISGYYPTIVCLEWFSNSF